MSLLCINVNTVIGTALARNYLTGLTRDLEVVEERMPSSNRTLVDGGTAVRPIRSLLEQPVPMLPVEVN